MTTSNEIKQWFDDAASRGATHLVVVCDTFDWMDYPVAVMPDDDVEKVIGKHSINMQKVMEIYKISIGWEAQSIGRVHNI